MYWFLIIAGLVIVLLNIVLTKKSTWNKAGLYLINFFAVFTVVVTFMFIRASGGITWWSINTKYWMEYGTFFGGILLVITILLQLVSFRRQQIENKFFEMVKYYRDNVAGMQLHNPFHYDTKDRIYEEKIVTGRRVFKVIFDQYVVAYRLADLLLQIDVAKESKFLRNEGDYFNNFKGKRRRNKKIVLKKGYQKKADIE